MIKWGQPGSGLTPAPDLEHTVECDDFRHGPNGGPAKGPCVSDDCPGNVPQRLASRFAIREINLKNGLVLCECGRFKPIPKAWREGSQSLRFWQNMYMSNQNVLVGPGEEHECDPKWIKAELIKARATIDKSNKKLQEMQVGLQRLKDKLK